MECSAYNDFFIKFDKIEDKEGKFTKYKLNTISDNFSKVISIDPKSIIGKDISELLHTYKDEFLGIENIYYHLSPNNIKKFEIYIESLDRWYMMNIFNERSYIMVVYSDISITKSYLSSDSGINDTSLSGCHRDRLTGLYNKDFFQVELSRLDVERQLPLSIIIGDLNGLKLINDAFGYYMGDEAIKSAADILKKTFRKEDIISRFGGDEFVILLPNTTEEKAKERIAILKQKLVSLPLDFLQISMSLGSATKENMRQNIMNVFKIAEEKMYFNKLQESNSAKLKIIDFLKNRLMNTTIENSEHHERLKELAIAFGEELGLSSTEQIKLNLLCEYHDIGGVSIPNHIYYKEQPLTEGDWHMIRRHCEIGYHIMKSVSNDNNIAEHILMHHERWDGKGYPRLLKADEIPLINRVFHILDSYEAMINFRPYRQSLNSKEALEEIRRNSGSQFDPALAERFILMIERMQKRILVN